MMSYKSAPKLSLQRRFEGLLVLFGVLMSELRIAGIPLRTPVIALGVLCYKKPLLLLLVIQALLVYFLFDFDAVGFQKSNSLTYAIITIGAFICVQGSSYITARQINFALTGLIIIYLSQIMGMFPFTDVFVLEPDFYANRATGLSSEPSFTTWMALFLILNYYAVCGRLNILIYIIVAIHLLFGALINTLMVISLTFSIVLFSTITINKKALPMTVITALTLFIPLFLDILLRYFGTGLGHLMLYELRSWREISNFSSFWGASWVTLPAYGDYAETIYRGQMVLSGEYQVWINKPWSFFALQCVELGKIPALLIFFGLWRLFYIKTENHVKNGLQVAIYSFAIFLGPKWVVFLLINPFKNKRPEVEEFERKSPK